MSLRGRSKLSEKNLMFFVTTTVVNFERIFHSDKYFDILTDSLIFLISKYKAKLFGFVLMPNHIHLIIETVSAETISAFMRDFKKFTSTKIRKQLEVDGRVDLREKLLTNAVGVKGQVFKLWMDRFDDVMIFTEKIFYEKLNYIHFNPVKAGFVKSPEEWRYSSYQNYVFRNDSVIRVEMPFDTKFDLLSSPKT
jgi:putative transposase